MHGELRPLLERIVTHRFVAALEQGTVPKEVLKVLAAQQYKIVSRGLQNTALLLSRFGDRPSRTKLQQFLEAEYAVQEAVLVFAAALGLKEEDLWRAPAVLEAQMFSYYETFVCLYGTDAELITGLYFDAKVWIANAGRVSRALQQRYGFTPETTRFFDMYANYLPQDEETLPYIQAALERGVALGDCPGCTIDDVSLQAGLQRGIAAVQIRDSVRLLLEAEWYFWEAMARAAGL